MDEIIVEELNDYEEKIINSVYDKCEFALSEIYNSPSLDDVLLVAKTVSTVCGMLEAVKVGNSKLRGWQKKKISYYLGRKLVRENCSAQIQAIYEQSGDEIIEVFIGFAKVNKIVPKCYSSLIGFC